MYKKVATEYDTDYVKKYDEDLNTTLIFVCRLSFSLVKYLTCSQAGLFSAVSSAFVIDVHSNLQPDPNKQSAAILRVILLTLNQSAIPGETPTVPPVQERPPSEIVTVTCLMYASLFISLLAAFVAMLGKQWLNRYLRNSGGSVIERCGDRQRKLDGLEKWPFHSFVESLPVMLQTALLLLACGLCRYMWSINALVARTLISLTGLGVVFYIGIVIAGMSSYACPFQTPTSIALRVPWKNVWHGITTSIVHCRRVLSRTRRIWKRRVRRFIYRQSLLTIPLEDIQVQQSESVLIPGNSSRFESLSTLDSGPSPEPWFHPRELGIIHRTNTSDARCVSWILRNITDPETLDFALPVAGVVRWFDDGVNADPPYDLIVSTFKTCFDSTGTLYPGSRNRAYYSGRAMAWIRTLAMCKSEEFARKFRLRVSEYEYTTPVPDPDLEHLLYAASGPSNSGDYVGWLLRIDPGHTHSHLQWISNLLLHYCSANRTKLNHEDLLGCLYRTRKTKTTLPLNATLNRLLVWSTLLGSPVEEEALRVQLKSYGISCFCSSGHSLLFTSNYTECILYQLSDAVLSSINETNVRHKFIPYILDDLIKLENRPESLTSIAYKWCSVICENRDSFEGWERLLPVCLELGFRHLDFRSREIKVSLAHTEHHRGFVDVVFKTQESEVIADLLHAWTVEGTFGIPTKELLGFCTRHLVGLHDLLPFSPRLQHLIVRSIEIIGYEGFEGVGVEKFVELLNQLHVTAEDINIKPLWVKLFFSIIQSSEGVQRLSHSYWKLLVELAASESQLLGPDLACSPQIITSSLAEAKEWSKLECWMGILWMLGVGGMTEEDIERSMVLLFRQRPGALQKLKQWMERWSKCPCNSVPETFQRICEQETT